MDKRLENLRTFFPAEVTGAYVAMQAVLAANGIQKTEYMNWMIVFAIVLVIVNAAIYWKLYDAIGISTQIVLAAGFLIWVMNVDTPRFKDFELKNLKIELVAPTLLIFYMLLTTFISAPRRKQDV